MSGPSADVQWLKSLPSVRETCTRACEAAEKDALQHWKVDFDKLDAVAEFVAQVTKDAYPDLKVPFHSRWRHFSPDGVDRVQSMVNGGTFPEEQEVQRAVRMLDLAIVSVLLDAGAGAAWKYVCPQTKQSIGRSEGLAVASIDMFKSGAFSSNVDADPARADSTALQSLTIDALGQGLQVSESNPLVGLEGRCQLLQRLGKAVAESEHFVAPDGSRRPGNLLHWCLAKGDGKTVDITNLWEAVVYGMQTVWPESRSSLEGFNLGDVWQMPAFEDQSSTRDKYACFHKLSQWLTYSLLEPIQDAGFEIKGIEHMTGLAEYRNGGLFTDMGVLVPKNEAALSNSHDVTGTFVVEWRALTVGLLDRLAPIVRSKLGLSAEEYPLACVLQGGTWTAGRMTARKLRQDGGPPFQLISDGTVF